MGSSDSKTGSQSSPASAATADASVAGNSPVMVRTPRGVKLRHLDGNNYLGRLADAPKFAGSSTLFSPATPASRFWPGSGLDSSCDCGGAGGGSSSASRRLTTSVESCHSPTPPPPQQQAQPQLLSAERQPYAATNLTTLLMRGFDPSDYERRAAETRARRRLQRQHHQQPQRIA